MDGEQESRWVGRVGNLRAYHIKSRPLVVVTSIVHAHTGHIDYIFLEAAFSFFSAASRAASDSTLASDHLCQGMNVPAASASRCLAAASRRRRTSCSRAISPFASDVLPISSAPSRVDCKGSVTNLQRELSDIVPQRPSCLLPP
jgi:hypothetical protein